MIRRAGVLLTGLLVVLAVVQGLLFAALPALNHWRGEIEQIVSRQLAIPVQLSEVGVRLSIRGPYVEALDVVIEQPTVRLELRRLQVILDLWESIRRGAPVIASLAVDEGSAVWLGDSTVATTDPWNVAATTLATLQAASTRIGNASVDDFTVIADGWTLARVDLNLVPSQGILARARLETESQTLPVRLDWRFATTPEAPQMIYWAIDDARVPVRITEDSELLLGVQTRGTVVIAGQAPVTGTVSTQITDLEDLGLSVGFTATVQAESPTRWAWVADQFEAALPGVQVMGPLSGQWVDGQFALTLDRADVDTVATRPWVDRWLPETVLSRVFAVNQPQVQLRAITAHWSAQQGLALTSEVETASISAGRGIPTLGPVRGTLYAEGQTGWFAFTGATATFGLPEIFPADWSAHAVSGRLVWARGEEGLTIIGRDLRVKGPDQDVRGELLLDLPRESQQGLQLELTADARVQAMPGLLPTALASEVRDFLLKTIQEAEIRGARIHYAGPLGPTDPINRRELVMAFPLTRIAFQPLAEWPAFVGTQGLVRWANRRATVSLAQPQFGPLAVTEVTARQDRLDGQVIHVEGRLRGSSEAVQTVLQSAGVKPAALGQTVLLSGDLSGDVSLRIPLGKAPQGQITIASDNARVAFAGWSHVLTEIRGDAVFEFGQGLTAQSLQARLLETPVTVALRATDQTFTGELTGVFSATDAVALAGLSVPVERLSGASPWRVEVSSSGETLQINANTSGEGVLSTLPSPLATQSEQSAQPIRIELIRRGPVMTVTGDIFDQVRFSGELSADPAVFQVEASEIDLIGWAGLGGQTGDATNLSIAVSTERAWLGETPLAVERIQLERTPRSVTVSLMGADLQGTISRAGQDPVSIRLDTIRLPPGGAFLDPPGADPLVDFDPGALPPMAVAIERLERGEQHYERVYLDLRPGPERLDVNNLSFVREGQLFTGELAWDLGEAEVRSALILRAQGPDLGNFLRVNAKQPLLEAKRGQLTVSAQWTGSPLVFSPLTAEGEILLTLEDGRFLELGNTAEVLRLFGILNIETLTRRLRLDFLDLVKPGVAFDVVKAQATLGDGLLRLSPALEMQGPASSFRLTGDANLATKTLQQRLSVDIPLTGNLPLASVLLGAPQIGGAIYFVEKAFGTKIIQVGKTEYSIEGAFSDPKITLIPPFTKPKETPNAQPNRDP